MSQFTENSYTCHLPIFFIINQPCMVQFPNCISQPLKCSEKVSAVCGCFCFMHFCAFCTLLCILFIFVHYGHFCAFCALWCIVWNLVIIMQFVAFLNSLVHFGTFWCISDSTLYRWSPLSTNPDIVQFQIIIKSTNSFIQYDFFEKK